MRIFGYYLVVNSNLSSYSTSMDLLHSCRRKVVLHNKKKVKLLSHNWITRANVNMQNTTFTMNFCFCSFILALVLRPQENIQTFLL